MVFAFDQVNEAVGASLYQLDAWEQGFVGDLVFMRMLT